MMNRGRVLRRLFLRTTIAAGRLFNGSCVALIVTALAFAIRGGIMSDWSVQFGLTGTQLGWIAGGAFWGTALSILIGGPLCDFLGIGRLLMVQPGQQRHLVAAMLGPPARHVRLLVPAQQ